MSDYGSISEVTAFTRHLLAGETAYNTLTNPTEADVTRFLDRASAVMNVALAGAGFAIPVTQATAKLAIDDWVVQRAVEYVELTQRGAGYSDAEGNRHSAFANLAGRAAKFVEENARGFKRLGVPLAQAASAGLAFTALNTERPDRTDASLEQPKFTRDQFDHPEAQ